MPMYEFRCNKCHKTFTRLLWKTPEDNEVTCPECGNQDVQRLISGFSSFGSFRTGSSGSVCGGGAFT